MDRQNANSCTNRLDGHRRAGIPGRHPEFVLSTIVLEELAPDAVVHRRDVDLLAAGMPVSCVDRTSRRHGKPRLLKRGDATQRQRA